VKVNFGFVLKTVSGCTVLREKQPPAERRFNRFILNKRADYRRARDSFA
jgi:hypothetical protein